MIKGKTQKEQEICGKTLCEYALKSRKQRTKKAKTNGKWMQKTKLKTNNSEDKERVPPGGTGGNRTSR